jgi:hypothetical protein
LAIGFPEVSGGKIVLYLEGFTRLFAIARVANPKNEPNLIPNLTNPGTLETNLEQK